MHMFVLLVIVVFDSSRVVVVHLTDIFVIQGLTLIFSNSQEVGGKEKEIFKKKSLLPRITVFYFDNTSFIK